MENNKVFTWVIVIITIIIGILLIRSAIMTPNMSNDQTYDQNENLNQNTHQYQSGQYGFSFTVPQIYAIKEYIPEAVAIGTSTNGGQGFDSIAEVLVSKSEQGSNYKNFDDFVFQTSRNMCAADGPRETIYCDKMFNITATTTANGLQGTEFFLNRVTENLATHQKTNETFGPLYAFNIQANAPGSQYAALIIRPPISSQRTIPPEIIPAILKSLQIHAVNSLNES